MHFKQLLNQGFQVKKYLKNSIVYEPGMHARFVYFIISGEIKMVTTSNDNKAFIQGVFKAGQYFGEPALLVDKPYLAHTIATKDTELILVGKSDFLKLLKKDPEFSMELIQVLSNRLFYKSMMLEEVANENAEHRLLTLITYLSKDLSTGEPLKYTRQELADMTGLRVETVIRGIKSLINNHSIQVIKGKIIKP